jgi:glyoxylase-like metal-dependent hydrolase (beta-lactamase superfamily II)
MKVQRIPVGMFATNCVIVEDEATRSALVIDPGADGDMLARRLEGQGVTPVLIVLTHAHIDHCLDASLLARRWRVGIAMHADELPLYRNMRLQASALLGSDDLVRGDLVEPTTLLKEGDTVAAGATQGRVVSLPGHSPGGIGLLFPGNPQTLVCGDTIFRDGVGRTDLWGGDWDTLLGSIRLRVFTLPDDTRLVTGHGAETTVGREKRAFPY